MREFGTKETILSAYLLAVFFSFINTPLFFDLNQINNQAFIALSHINVPLQIFPLTFIFIYFLGFRKNSVLYLALASILIFLVASLPEMPNHRYVILFTCSYLFYSCIFDGDKLLIDKLAMFSRSLLSVIYFFAFLAKLNSGYLNTNISCATVFYENVRQTSFSFFPSNNLAHLFAIYFSLIFEGLACVLIFNRRARLYVVLAGLIFHLGLSLDLIKYFTNFSSIMSFLLFSSLGGSIYDRLKGELARLGKNTVIHKLFILTLFFTLLCCLVAGLESSPYANLALNALIFVRHILWLTIAFFVLYQVFSFSKTYRAEEQITTRLQLFPIALITLLAFSCLGPYLGYKTRSALTMYSNLRLEQDYSNHFIFPKSGNSLGFLSDFAHIVDTNGSCPTSLKKGLSYPLFEIARVDKRCPGEISEINYQGENIAYDDLKWAEIMSKVDYPILSKLLVFGPIGNEAEKECVW